MNNTAFLAIFFFVMLAIVAFRASLARYFTRRYITDLKKRGTGEFEINLKREKMLKNLKVIFLVGGMLFSVISLLLLVGESIGLFTAQNMITLDGVTETSIFKKIWDFAGVVLFVGIVLYVLEWYGVFKWPWRK